MQCVSCGSSDVFLREKSTKTGVSVGLYCLYCGRWYKWVGKAELGTLTRSGLKVNKEDYSPDTNRSTDEIVHFTDLGGVSSNSVSGAKYKSSSVTSSSSSNSDPCPTCISGILDPIGASESLSLSIFEGVVLVKSKDNSRLYGSYRIIYCPTCGKKL